jgi:serine-type D-Ala-D-Ala carboxypeptidase
MKKLTIGIVLVFLVLIGISCRSAKHSTTSFDTHKNEIFIDSMMNNALDKGFFPGAQIIVGSKDAIFISKNYGYHDYSKKQPVTRENIK